MARPTLRLLSGALLGALLASVVAAEAPTAADREQDLTAIRRQVVRLQGELRRARTREHTLEERLATAEIDLRLQRERVAEATAAQSEARRRVAATGEAVERLAAALDEARRGLERRLAGLYRLGRDGYLRLVLSVRPGPDLPAAIRLLRFLVRRDAGAVDRYVESKTRLETERDRLVAEQREVERWVAEAQARRDELASARARQTRLLARAQEESRRLAARAQDLVDKERKLANLLDFLYGRSTTPLAGQPIQEFRGVLDWPLDGRVTLGFGPRRDPRYQTEIPHNGIEIAPRAEGEKVRTIYPGKVLFAAPFEGYGQTVVVHHAGRVFTLYAGLETLLVHQGDVLELGAIVGVASRRVYFEIRRENRPEDPLEWLRRPVGSGGWIRPFR